MEIRPIDANALVASLCQLSEAYNEAHDMLEDGDHKKAVMYGKFTTIVETILHIKRKEPTIDYAPVKHGEWIHCFTFMPLPEGHMWADCSLCGADYRGLKDNANYCPHCGAKMDGGKV